MQMKTIVVIPPRRSDLRLLINNDVGDALFLQTSGASQSGNACSND